MDPDRDRWPAWFRGRIPWALALRAVVVIAAAAVPGATAAQTEGVRGETCRPAAARVRIDHVVVAVHSLAAATDTFTDLGFRWKDGRLHANGLT